MASVYVLQRRLHNHWTTRIYVESFNKFVLEDKEKEKEKKMFSKARNYKRNFSYPIKLVCIDISHTRERNGTSRERNKFSIQLPE